MKFYGKPVQFLVIFFCALAGINSGVGYGWQTISFPVLLHSTNNESTFKITSAESVWVATLTVPGIIIGSLLTTLLSNIAGRQPMILLANIPFFISWLILAEATAIYQLYMGRLLTGIATGIVMTLLPIYTAEIVSPDVRGALCGMMALCFSGGIFLINLLDLWLTYEIITLICLVFPIISFVGLAFIPDSPYFYIIKKKPEKAKRAIKIFRGPSDIDKLFDRFQTVIETQKSLNKGAIKALFKIESNRRAFLILLLLRAVMSGCGFNILIYFVSEIVGEAGSSLSIQYLKLIFASFLVASVIVAMCLVDRLGRRVLIITSIAGVFVFELSLSVCLHLKHLKVSNPSISYILLISINGIALAYGMGIQQLPYIIHGEVFPTGVKTPAALLSLICQATLNFLFTEYYQVITVNFGNYIAFYSFCAMTLLLLLPVILFVPETKNILLEDIQLMLQQKKIYFKDVDTSSRVVQNQ